MLEILFKLESDGKALQKCLQGQGISSEIHTTLFQNQTHFLVTFQLEERAKEALKTFILDVKRKDWSSFFLTDSFYFHDENEHEQILQIVLEMFSGERVELVSLLNEWDEDTFIYQAIDLLLTGREPVSFDTFVKFRLKRYQNRLLQYIELAIDEYKMEQDYQMFIHTLRDYISTKKEELHHIHLYLYNHESFFYNEAFREMKREELLSKMDKRLLVNHPLYIDSVTIAPLLSLAPKKIYLYFNQEENGLVRTIQKIFEERVVILPSSELLSNFEGNGKGVVNE
ncbi:putative sporulation protein YtxC [Bacillus sp. 2205SS5-2]|uniref:putative sporulation protein YtxC n=1 Tax=Bacillus sp. 2205SS5-2 TaxID=3109031 RepID=UPI0030073F1F